MPSLLPVLPASFKPGVWIFLSPIRHCLSSCAAVISVRVCAGPNHQGCDVPEGCLSHQCPILPETGALPSAVFGLYCSRESWPLFRLPSPDIEEDHSIMLERTGHGCCGRGLPFAGATIFDHREHTCFGICCNTILPTWIAIAWPNQDRGSHWVDRCSRSLPSVLLWFAVHKSLYETCLVKGRRIDEPAFPNNLVEKSCRVRFAVVGGTRLAPYALK